MSEEPGTTIVLDQGSHSCKLGVNSEDSPRIFARSVCAVPSSNASELLYFGGEALNRPDSHTVRELIGAGGVLDWPMLEQFWLHQLGDLQVEPAQTAVLMGHHTFASRLQREQSAQVFFEKLNAPRFFSVPDPLLALYSSGRVSGLVLDSGHSASAAVPVLDGLVMGWAQAFDRVAGRELTERLARRLGLTEQQAAAVKENDARVSADFEREANEFAAQRLPDGNTLRLTAALWAGESLFAPQVAGRTGPSLADLVCDALLKLEPEERRELATGIIPAGGTTSLPGLTERLQREVELILPCTPRVKVINTSDRQSMVWCGGAVVSSLSTFHPMWVTRTEYEEFGPAIVTRKGI